MDLGLLKDIATTGATIVGAVAAVLAMRVYYATRVCDTPSGWQAYTRNFTSDLI